MDADIIESLRSVSSCLQQVKSALRLIERLVDRSATHIRTSLDSLVFKRGLRLKLIHLPDDIISVIFAYAHESSTNDPNPLTSIRTSLRLSHICRRCRFMALAMPDLWTTLSSLQHPDSIPHFILLSKEQPLRVSFVAQTPMFNILAHNSDAVMKRNTFLQDVMPLSTRWRSFNLSFTPTEDDEELDLILPGLVRAFRNIKLDALEKLTVRFEGWFGALRDGTSTSSLFSSWHTPKLRHCAVVDFIPTLPVSKLVTSLNLEFVGEITDPVEAEQFLEFVGHHKNLSDLALSFGPTNHESFEVVDGVRFRRGMNLPLLKKLKISTVVGHSYDVVRYVLRSLSRSNLEEVVMEFRICLHDDGEEAEDILNSLQFPRELNLCLRELSRHESLKSFTLKIGQKTRDNPFHGRWNNALDSIFPNLKNIQHLAIFAPDFPSPKIKAIPAQLRTLSLDTCLRFDDNFFNDFFGTLKSGGSLESFEKLMVDGCVNLRKNTATKFLPSSKILWEEFN